jgi:hypothetical protein
MARSPKQSNSKARVSACAGVALALAAGATDTAAAKGGKQPDSQAPPAPAAKSDGQQQQQQQAQQPKAQQQKAQQQAEHQQAQEQKQADKQAAAQAKKDDAAHKHAAQQQAAQQQAQQQQAQQQQAQQQHAAQQQAAQQHAAEQHAAQVAAQQAAAAQKRLAQQQAAAQKAAERQASKQSQAPAVPKGSGADTSSAPASVPTVDASSPQLVAIESAAGKVLVTKSRRPARHGTPRVGNQASTLPLAVFDVLGTASIAQPVPLRFVRRDSPGRERRDATHRAAPLAVERLDTVLPPARIAEASVIPDEGGPSSLRSLSVATLLLIALGALVGIVREFRDVLRS